MDVGTFKASKARLIMWIVIPPMLIVIVGLSSYALQQRAEWKLQETQALSNVLPDVIEAKKDVQTLYDELGLSKDKRISSGDELVSILEEEARRRRIELKRTQVIDREMPKGAKIPVISVIIDASGEFSDFQLFLNDIKTAHPLVSTRSATLDQSEDGAAESGFDLKVVFDLLLVGDVLKASGG
jgi:hypothetical protein